MQLLIDGDSAIYKAGMANETRWYRIYTEQGNVAGEFQYKKEVDAWLASQEDASQYEVEKCREVGPLGHTLANVKQVVRRMVSPEHDTHQIFIKGEGNFRDGLYPEYKANRKDSDKPLHMEEIVDYLVRTWGAVQVNNEEADDRVSWMQCTTTRETCIVAIDKDLLNTPGWHYNYDKDIKQYITREEADVNFARQLLSGDVSDNIPGLAKIGTGIANKLLPVYRPDWEKVVYEKYVEQFGERAEEMITLYGRLLWMRRAPDEMWELGYDYEGSWDE